jgi:hypothetical protein
MLCGICKDFPNYTIKWFGGAGENSSAFFMRADSVGKPQQIYIMKSSEKTGNVHENGGWNLTPAVEACK